MYRLLNYDNLTQLTFTININDILKTIPIIIPYCTYYPTYIIQSACEVWINILSFNTHKVNYLCLVSC